ncbi:MAG TPA: hypothetical protein VJL81_16315 [Solirubrobacterales bacterium]|nr:hypothetical protein [Solirubrobacterales bacterium]
MEAARATWTDSRLDDLNDRVKSMDAKMDAGFSRLDERIDKLQHTIIVVGGGLVAAMLAVLAAMIGTIVTLLLTHF